MILLFFLIGQIPTDPLSGGAGWVGTGLLGSVLGWLLFVHLPNKDKQILGLVESRDKLVEKLTSDFRVALDAVVDKQGVKDREQREDFKESLQKVVDHCEKEVGNNIEALKKEVERIGGYVGELTRKVHEERRGG